MAINQFDSIPAYSTLVFEVELLELHRNRKQPFQIAFSLGKQPLGIKWTNR